MTTNGADLTLNRRSPVISFTSLDYDSAHEDLTVFAVQDAASRDEVLDTSAGSLPNFAVILGSYLVDLMGGHVNGTVRELFASTCTRRENLIKLGKPFGIEPAPPTSARVTLRLFLGADPTLYPTRIVEDDQFSTEGETPIYYHPVGETQVLSYPGSGYVDIPCIEGELYDQVLVGISDGSQAQKISLTLRGVVVSSVVVTVANVTWTRVQTFVNSGSTSQHYRVVFDDLGNVSLYFGDGVNGAVPANNSQIRARYRVGGGRRGRVLEDTVTSIVNANQAILSTTNPEASNEGENAQPMKTARYALGNAFSTMLRGVEETDFGKLALQAAPNSIAKARSKHIGNSFVDVIIAPNGGGQPSDPLKNEVLTFFEGKKVVRSKPRVFGPTYRNVRFSALLYVNDSFRSEDVKTATLRGLLSAQGDGILNFAQLDFGAVTITESGSAELLLSSTRLQSYFASLKPRGLERAEIQILDVEPIATPSRNNTGNGSFSVLVAPGTKNRRTYRITMTTPTSYNVSETVTGIVASITDQRIYDPSSNLAALGVTTAWRVQPDVNASSMFPITAIGSDFLEVSPTSGTLFSHTAPRRTYALHGPSLVSGGLTPIVLGDTTLAFTPGTNAHVGGDRFEVDVYPQVSDLRLRSEEYPEVISANLDLRVIGGARSLPMQATFVSTQGGTAGVPYVDPNPHAPAGTYTFTDTIGDGGSLVSRLWEVIGFNDYGSVANPTPSSTTTASMTINVSASARVNTSTMLLVRCTRTLSGGATSYDVGVVIIPDNEGNAVPAPGLQPWMVQALTPANGWAGGYDHVGGTGATGLINGVLNSLQQNPPRYSVRSGDPLVCLSTDVGRKLVGVIALEPDVRGALIDSRVFRLRLACLAVNCGGSIAVEDAAGASVASGTMPVVTDTAVPSVKDIDMTVSGANGGLFWVYAQTSSPTPPASFTVFRADVFPHRVVLA